MLNASSRPVPLLTVCVIVTATLLASAPPGFAVEVPVEGDRDALLALSDALTDADGREIEHGRIEYRCTHTLTNTPAGGEPNVDRSIAEGVVVWDGPRTRWTFLEDRAGTDYPGGDRPVTPGRSRAVVWGPRTGIKYDGGTKVAQVFPTSRPDPTDDLLHVRPRDGWFRLARESRPWGRMLDPRNPLPSVVGLAADRDEAHLEVRIEFRSGATYEVEGDLVTGTIVRERREMLRPVEMRWRGEATWEVTPDAPIPYPTSLRRVRTERRPDGGTGEEVWELAVSALDAGYRPPAGFAELRALDLPPGTLVKYLDRENKVVRQVRTADERTDAQREAEMIEALAGRNAAGNLAGGSEDSEDRQ